MSWFFIALLGPILYACANHVDKLLLSGFFKNGKIGAIIIYSALFSIVAIPIIMLIQPEVDNVSIVQVITLVGIGMLGVVAVLLYLYALDTDEVSFVIPFYQTVPIFAYFLGYFILGETITVAQGMGSFVIILGALVLSFEFGRQRIRFKSRVVVLMLIASLLNAVNGVIFKLVASDKGFWLSIFWGFVGQVLVGVVFLVCAPTYRRQFLVLLKENKAATLGLISLSEALFIVGEVATLYAMLLAPVVLVLLVNSFQPFFVFAIGVLLTLFLPKLGRESLGRAQIIQKVLGIAFMLIGSFLIST